MVNHETILMAFFTANLNIPYIWGGKNPDGYDCSGMAQMALRPFGLDPPGDQTANALFKIADSLYRRVNLNISGSWVDEVGDDPPILRMGDLIFYGSIQKASHVSIGVRGKIAFDAPNGGQICTTKEIAYSRGAFFQFLPAWRRTDFVKVYRPKYPKWNEL